MSDYFSDLEKVIEQIYKRLADNQRKTDKDRVEYERQLQADLRKNQDEHWARYGRIGLARRK